MLLAATVTKNIPNAFMGHHATCPCALGRNVCVQFTPILYTAVYF